MFIDYTVQCCAMSIVTSVTNMNGLISVLGYYVTDLFSNLKM
jgi:hypothetical protein